MLKIRVKSGHWTLINKRAIHDVHIEHSTINRWVIHYSPQLKMNLDNVLKGKRVMAGVWMRLISK